MSHKKISVHLQLQYLPSNFETPSLKNQIPILIKDFPLPNKTKMYINRPLKLFTVLLFLFATIISCKKKKPKDDPQDPGETPSVYESIFTPHNVSFCGTVSTSNLKIKDGTDIGTVTVSNDSFYLYMTYNLTGNWYLGDVHSYAGRESSIPRNIDGNPTYLQFPGKQKLSFCDLRQTFTFRVSLSAITKDNSAQCPSNEQYYVAMRASVRQFNNSGECVSGVDQAAWGAPFLINPGNANEWATAFYYCKQDCAAPAPSACGYSQGYWFSNPNPNAAWCQNVKFGNLEVTETQGDALWPPQNSLVKKAFFQGSALQLSMNCYNSGIPMPTSISSDYNRLETFLSTLTYADLQSGTWPITSDTTGVRAAATNVGKWICTNHCTTNSDPNACTGY